MIRKRTILCAFLLLTGCAAHKAAVKPEPTPQPMATVQPAVKRAQPVHQTLAQPQRSYSVRRGDCLWTIAAKPSVLGDPFQWPLLWRANRDQVSDPDLIEPGMKLAYKRKYSDLEEGLARMQAKKRAPYRRHKK